MSETLARRNEKARVGEAHRRQCGECANCREREESKRVYDEAMSRANELGRAYFRLITAPCLNPKNPWSRKEKPNEP